MLSAFSAMTMLHVIDLIDDGTDGGREGGTRISRVGGALHCCADRIGYYCDYGVDRPGLRKK